MPCYTFGGVLGQHNAAGCEILVVDAEGVDCAIVRSMIDACSSGRSKWPAIVRYETRGLDRHLEESTLRRLQIEGYLVLDVSGDVTAVHGPRFRASSALRQWADKHFWLACYVCGWQAWPSQPSFDEMVGQGSTQWFGTTQDQEALRRDRSLGQWLGSTWCCSSCYWSEATLFNGSRLSQSCS